MNDESGQPLVSVITAVLNGEAYIEDTIKSVANQTYPKVEHVIIDGGSRDGTLGIIADHPERIDHWISEPDHGMYEALNKGIRLSKGEILTFLNSDDYFHDKHAIERVVNEFQHRADIDWLYCNVRVLRDGEFYVYRIPPYDRGALLSMSWCYIPHPGSFFRRELFNKLGLYDERYRLVGDYEFFLRIGNRSRQEHISTPIVTYRHHANRLTERASGRRNAELKAVQKEYSSRKSDRLRMIRAFVLALRFHFLNLDVHFASVLGKVKHVFRPLLGCHE